MGAILILVSLLILLLGVLFGFLRGTVRSAIRLGTLVFALLLALLLANALSSVLGGLFAPLVEDLFFSGEGMADLIRTNPEMPDLILVMDGCTVVAQGNHETLMATSDIYREVYESQVKGGEE